jgi:acyl-coenzyme A thioesterase PaaI-like protein
MWAPNINLLVCSPKSMERESKELTFAAAREILQTRFAPWIQDLDLIVQEFSPTGATLRLPYSEKLSRAGRQICGQALMACADTAMVIAVCCAFGEFKNMAMVGQTISFMRPITKADVIIDANVLKLGETIVFGEIFLAAAGTDGIAAHATATYALLP